MVGPDGEVLATRVLHHPHTNEQPFTRSFGGVEIAAGIARVELRARDGDRHHPLHRAARPLRPGFPGAGLERPAPATTRRRKP